MKIKVYIVTYRRNKVLNNLVKNLDDTGFFDLNESQVNIINNHSDFHIDEKYRSKTRVLHNMTRPDWSCGNLAENYNQALVDGFRNLIKPDCDIVITLQNDAVLCDDWLDNLLKMHEKYSFVVGQYGDTIVSYKPEAVRKIGMWDENFVTVQHKEGDYWIRALVFNKEKSCINDTLHGRLLNNHDSLLLDITGDQNFQNVGGTIKKLVDDAEHAYIKPRMTRCSALLLNYFQAKWSGTWKSSPQREGWLVNWPSDFVESPPSPPRRLPIYVRYPYFEKDIENLIEKSYFVPPVEWYERYDGGDEEYWSDVK
jgi:hypothetical protein